MAIGMSRYTELASRRVDGSAESLNENHQSEELSYF
jgi:hypothetical protein